MTGEEQPQDHAGELFTKADFHIHTPESRCYSEPGATPAQIVESALAACLGAIAITDHNTVVAIDPARQIGRKRGLVVFPGIEVSTTSGHLLTLFDPETPVAEMEDFLDHIGTRPAARGDGTIAVGDTIEAVLCKTTERGGIAIAAHIERWPTGFLQTKESRRAKQKVYDSEHLAALEITQPQNKDLWNRGEMRGFPRGRACIQGSDAHALNEIGRRPVYLKLASCDLAGLRRAFSHYEGSIAFPDDPPFQHES